MISFIKQANLQQKNDVAQDLEQHHFCFISIFTSTSLLTLQNYLMHFEDFL